METTPYPTTGIPEWIDDDAATIPVDTREMKLTAQASMYLDTACTALRD